VAFNYLVVTHQAEDFLECGHNSAGTWLSIQEFGNRNGLKILLQVTFLIFLKLLTILTKEIYEIKSY